MSSEIRISEQQGPTLTIQMPYSAGQPFYPLAFIHEMIVKYIASCILPRKSTHLEVRHEWTEALKCLLVQQ